MQFLKKNSFLPALAFFVLTVVLLTLPGNRFPHSRFFNIPYFDKWVHIGLFATLCFLFSLPIQDRKISLNQKKMLFLLISMLGIFYGVAMEFVQKYWVINRSFEGMDIVADSLGCLLAFITSIRVLRGSN